VPTLRVALITERGCHHIIHINTSTLKSTSIGSIKIGCHQCSVTPFQGYLPEFLTWFKFGLALFKAESLSITNTPITGCHPGRREGACRLPKRGCDHNPTNQSTANKERLPHKEDKN